MFLRKVVFLSAVQAEVECCVVDRIWSHDVCYVAAGYLIVCLFRKSYGVPRHFSGGETLRLSKFHHGKTHALELDDEELACIVLGTIFDPYVWE